MYIYIYSSIYHVEILEQIEYGYFKTTSRIIRICMVMFFKSHSLSMTKGESGSVLAAEIPMERTTFTIC